MSRANNVVPHTDQRVSFHQTFKTPPAFIAGIETTNDTASAHCRSLDLYQADVQIQEEQLQRSAIDQTAEVGYMVFGAS